MGVRARVTGGIGLAVASTLLTFSGCNPLPVTIAARPLGPITVGEIRRIAVVPFTSAGLAPDRETGPGTEPLAEPPGDTVTHAMLAAMREYPDWQLVDQLTVGEALRQLHGEIRPPTPSEVQAVGKILRVDAVLRGEVRVFEERIGTELAAKRPAHVVFAVELLRMPDGVPVWQAEYAEQQQSLSENLWNLPGFVRAGGTWVRAGELAQLGATQMVTRLHAALYGSPPKKRPTTTRR
jgi:TolB-like protein